ncbi:MAG: LPS export ABC transporter periplasmic protein LptC [Alphaproteobacteria bacterium]|nr:LPS export ABC transporter periplasmic protein LptC [Alphaproteobacteria bacterium]
MQDQPQKLQLLSTPHRHKALNLRYSRLIRRLRLLLPLGALAIGVVVLSWQLIEDRQIEAISADIPLPALGRNELISPRFESRDEKGQPFTITASRALQDSGRTDLVLLQHPQGEIILQAGDVLRIRSDKGAFSQNTQRLVLNDHVVLSTDQNYTLNSASFHVDMAEGVAWSDDKVNGQGPAGTIDAAGLKAWSAQEHLIFKGPARLVLTNIGDGEGLKGL